MYKMNPVHRLRGAPCTVFTPYENYFQSDEVKKALNISDSSAKWQACNDAFSLGGTYTPYPPGTISFMPELTQKIKVVVYNGELDAVIPFLLNDHYVETIV